MARKAKNQITIEPVYATVDGKITDIVATYRLVGSIDGQRVRQQSNNLTELEAERDRLLGVAATLEALTHVRPVATFLSPNQVRQAEAVFTEFQTLRLPLRDYVRAGVNQLGAGDRVPIVTARTAWLANMQSPIVDTSKPVQDRNLRLLDAYTAHAKITTLDEMTPANIRKFLERPLDGRDGAAKTQTRLTHALCLQAFCNFCLEGDTPLMNISPFKIDLAPMVRMAKAERDRPLILKPAQAAALLDAALAECVELVPYILFATWCFIRDAEIGRLDHDDVVLDAKRPYVNFTGKKFGSSMRQVFIPENILPLLRACMEQNVWEKGKPPFFSRAYFDLVRERAGLIKRAAPDKHGFRRILKEGLHWQSHIQRHTGISYHFNFYGDIVATTRQAGNSPATAFAHYLHVPGEGDAEAFYAITRVLKKGIAQESAQAVA